MGDTYVWLLTCVYSCWYMCICMFVCVYAPWSSFYTVSQFLFSFYTLEFILQNCRVFFLWYSLCILIKITALKYIWSLFSHEICRFFCFILCFRLHPLCCITFCSLCICRLSLFVIRVTQWESHVKSDKCHVLYPVMTGFVLCFNPWLLMYESFL